MNSMLILYSQRELYYNLLVFIDVCCAKNFAGGMKFFVKVLNQPEVTFAVLSC